MPEDITQVNLIEITPDQLTAPNLQVAIAAAASSTLPDLVVVRTTDTQNTITYASSSDQLAIDVLSIRGTINIIGYGSQPLTLDANSHCGVISIGGYYYYSSAPVGLGGMVLTHGNAYEGGGLFQFSGALAMVNVTVSGNTASNSGGGIYQHEGTLVLTNVTLWGNTAEYGGGIYGYDGEATLTDVVLSGNTAEYGGGIHSDASTFTLKDVTLSGNAAEYGGGIHSDAGTFTLKDVTLSGNAAESDGGAVRLEEGTSTLENVTIARNSAGLGGGLELEKGICRMTNVTISDNNSTSYGGGIHTDFGTLTMTNVTISGNTASDGGGLHLFESTSRLTNVLISGNSASQYGGGVHHWIGALTLTNVTISDNTAQAGGGVYMLFDTVVMRNTIVARNAAGDGPDIRRDPMYHGKLSASFCLIGDGSGQKALRNRVQGNFVGTHDKPIDPRFVNTIGTDWTKWDLRLQPTSPAINRGSSSLIPRGVRTDLAGNRRVFGRRVDIGAYELQGVPLLVSTSIYGGAAQRSMVTQIVVVFRQRVTLGDGAITVLLSSGEVVPDTIVDITNTSGNAKKYVVTFRGDGAIGGSLADGVYDLVVRGEYATDMAGNPLCGTYGLRFHRLFGDVDGNGIVNAADQERLQIARSPSGTRVLKSIFDYDGDGMVNDLDVNEFLHRYGTGV